MDCRVGKLSLMSDRDSLHRAAAMVEDALRTASSPRLPPSALLVVKKIRLGKIQPARHSGRLAGVISRELGDIVPVLVQEGSEEHPDAPSVWFRDETEPLVLSALLAARGETPRSWYWQRVLQWRPDLSPQEGLRAALTSLAARPYASSAVVAVIWRLAAIGRLERSLEALTDRDVDTIFACFGEPTVPLSALAAVAMARQITTSQWGEVIRNLARRRGSSDRKVHIVARAAQVAVFGRMLSADVSALLLRESSSMIVAEAVIPGSPEPVIVSAQISSAPALAAAVEDIGFEEANCDNVPLRDMPESCRPVFLAQDAELPARAVVAEGDAPIRYREETAMVGDMQTGYGGFFFLLSLLQILRIDSVIEDLPLLPAIILRRAASRTQMPEDEPAFAILPKVQPDVPAAVIQWKPPESLRDFFPSSAALVTVEEVSSYYLIAMARYLRRKVGIGLRRLACRPALISMTATHLDVIFDGRQADVRIRRAGLDLDPGWLPWFGRVVRFHYRYES